MSQNIPAPQQWRVPDSLLQCPLIQDVLDTREECKVRLNPRRYTLVQSVRSYQVYGANRSITLHLSLLNSILFEMAKETAGRACVNGNISVLIQGDFHSRRQQVIDAASVIFINPKYCATNVQIQYVPLTINWTTDKNVIDKAVEQVTAAKRVRSSLQLQQAMHSICSQNECEPGHAAGVIIDYRNKTIQPYDSNGNTTPYYAVVLEWLERKIVRLRQFKDFVVVNQANVPQFGIQTASNLAMCGLFAMLYAALRITCSDIPFAIINTELLQIQHIRTFLNLWHCYILNYAFHKGVLQVFNEIQPLASRVFNRLINAKHYGMSEAQVNAAWEDLHKVQQLSFTNVLESYRLLKKWEQH